MCFFAATGAAEDIIAIGILKTRKTVLMKNDSENGSELFLTLNQVMTHLWRAELKWKLRQKLSTLILARG